MELMQASREWASRPDDRRFLTLESLRESVRQRRVESWTVTPATRELRALPLPDNEIGLQLHDPTAGESRVVRPTNWSFRQLAQYAGSAPASYLQTLPAELACMCLQWGLERRPLRDDALALCHTNGDDRLRSMTSTSYGRIWDEQVVTSVINANRDGCWQVPAASYSATNPKRATTLYASDRDVFLFLVDPTHPIEVGGEVLYRGFIVWNSEVGAATFGLTTFLYRVVCDNRIIWGATNVNELRIRHSRGAPERFAYEGAKYLNRYANESSQQAVAGILAAKREAIPVKTKDITDESVTDWLKSRGFTRAQAAASVQSARAEEGDVRTVWDIVNGVTAYARSMTHTDERVQLETKAGEIMAYAAAKAA